MSDLHITLHGDPRQGRGFSLLWGLPRHAGVGGRPPSLGTRGVSPYSVRVEVCAGLFARPPKSVGHKTEVSMVFALSIVALGSCLLLLTGFRKDK